MYSVVYISDSFHGPGIIGVLFTVNDGINVRRDKVWPYPFSIDTQLWNLSSVIN